MPKELRTHHNCQGVCDTNAKVEVIKSMLKLRPYKPEFMPVSPFDPATIAAFAQLLLGAAAVITAIRRPKPPGT